MAPPVPPPPPATVELLLPLPTVTAPPIVGTVAGIGSLFIGLAFIRAIIGFPLERNRGLIIIIMH
jgi:hypothetical protein